MQEMFGKMLGQDQFALLDLSYLWRVILGLNCLSLLPLSQCDSVNSI